jgi:putative transposase
MTSDFVLDALEQAKYARKADDDKELVSHSERVSQGVFNQYLSIRYTDRLLEAGIKASVGTAGDSYDNALAETINGLYKSELIHLRGPWKTKAAVEMATLEWVAWFNNKCLLSSIGYVQPAETDKIYYRQQQCEVLEGEVF